MFALNKEKNLPTEDLDNLLKKMGKSGLSDSQGSLTISPEKAREKLAQFLLPDPRHYVLNLVSCAVAGGAQSLDVTIGARESVFRFDGLGFSGEQLEGALAQVVAPTDTRLQELGVAINALLALPVSSLRITSWEGEKGCSYLWDGQNWQLAELQECPFGEGSPNNEIIVSEGIRLDRASQGLFGTLPERELLREKAAFGLSSLTVNDRAESRPVKLGATSSVCLAWMHCAAKDPKFCAEAPSEDWARHCLVIENHDFSENFDAVLAFNHEPPSADRDWLFLVNGVTFRRLVSMPGLPFVQGFVAANLRKNASHTDLVEDAHYQELLEKVRVLGEDLIVARLDSDLPLPRSSIRALLGKSEEFLVSLGQREAPTQLQRFRAWLLRVRFLDDLTNDTKFAKLMRELNTLTVEKRTIQLARLTAGLAEIAHGQVEELQIHQCKTTCGRLHQLASTWNLPITEKVDECLSLLSALVGQPSVERWEELRLHGSLGQAVKLADDPVQRALMTLAAGRFKIALAELEELDRENLDVLDGLSDLLAFSPNHRDLSRALELRERASEIRSRRTCTGAIS